MKNLFLIFTLLILPISTSLAQSKDEKKQDRKEYIQAQKIAFISTELLLTTKEAEVFWPIYNEYDAKLNEIHKERRGYMKELKGIDELTGDKAYELTEKILETEKNESQLRSDYLAKFAEVLDKKKAAKVFIAEEKFKRELLRQIQENYKDHDKPSHK